MIRAAKVEYWSAVGDIQMVQEVIAAGYDVNEREEDGYTALHAAVENEHIDIIKLLLQHGADVSAELVSGETPIDLAEMRQNEEILEILHNVGRYQ